MEEIINSVMQSPENTNPNVLRSQLQKIGEGGGGSAGWTTEETKTTVFDGSATGELLIAGVYAALLEDVSTPINTDKIFVTFNGIEYEALKRERTSGGVTAMEYGGTIDPSTQTADFSEYPFLIQSTGEMAGLYMSTAGPNTIKVETVSETVTPTDEFKAAVIASSEVDNIFFPVNVGFQIPFNLSEVPIQCEVDKTPNEVYEARTAGKIIMIRAYNIGSNGVTYTNPTLNAYITSIQKNASSGYFVVWGSNFIIRDTFSFNSNGFTITKSEKLYFVPDTSEATNGQVVTNDNGSPKWIDS